MHLRSKRTRNAPPLHRESMNIPRVSGNRGCRDRAEETTTNTAVTHPLAPRPALSLLQLMFAFTHHAVNTRCRNANISATCNRCTLLCDDPNPNKPSPGSRVCKRRDQAQLFHFNAPSPKLKSRGGPPVVMRSGRLAWKIISRFAATERQVRHRRLFLSLRIMKMILTIRLINPPITYIY